MLNTIKDFIVSIGDFFLTIWDFVIGIFEDIAYLIKLLGKAVVSIPKWLSWLPAEVVALIVAGLAVVVILRVLGRD